MSPTHTKAGSATEKLGRRCLTIETSPAFVDVAVKRWQLATGKTAVLDRSAKTFDDAAAERSDGNSPSRG